MYEWQAYEGNGYDMEYTGNQYEGVANQYDGNVYPMEYANNQFESNMKYENNFHQPKYHIDYVSDDNGSIQLSLKGDDDFKEFVEDLFDSSSSEDDTKESASNTGTYTKKINRQVFNTDDNTPPLGSKEQFETHKNDHSTEEIEQNTNKEDPAIQDSPSGNRTLQEESEEKVDEESADEAEEEKEDDEKEERKFKNKTKIKNKTKVKETKQKQSSKVATRQAKAYLSVSNQTNTNKNQISSQSNGHTPSYPVRDSNNHVQKPVVTTQPIHEQVVYEREHHVTNNSQDHVSISINQDEIKEPPERFGLGLFVLFCCCPPFFGCYALTRSCWVDEYLKERQYEKAKEASKSAKRVSIMGIIFGSCIYLGVIAFVLAKYAFT